MKYRNIFPVVAVALVSACSQTPVPIDASRVDNGALYFYNDPINDGPVLDQVATLNQNADDLVKSSRVNGALVGAALGCGLTAISGSNARNCVIGAALGGGGGAGIGTLVGERDVARRVELVSPDAVARNIYTAQTQFSSIKTRLPDFLAQQEATLNTLAVQLINGEIEQQEHDLAVLQIERDRMDLAEALTISARDARRASANLTEATRRGQNGLEWHISETSGLAEDVESTRLSFDL